MPGTLDNKILKERLSVLIENMVEYILVENENREIVYVNQKFCDMFMGSADSKNMIGVSCENAAEQSKDLFKNEDFIEKIDEILNNKVLVSGDILYLTNGTILSRDYIPVFIEGNYLGHMWKYRNLTKIRKLESDLQKYEKAFSYLIKGSISIVVLGVIGKIVYNILNSLV